jgi:hypothetical protein
VNRTGRRSCTKKRLKTENCYSYEPPVNSRLTFPRPRNNNAKFYSQTMTIIGISVLKTVILFIVYLGIHN